ncbi:major capsid protein [Methylobacterium sp. A49B]
MALDVNSTAQLLGAFGVLDRPSRFILDTFFKFFQQFDSEEVFFDQVQRARRLAAFVSDTVEGQILPSRGYATKSFTPPTVRPKHVVEPFKALKRRVGERLLGELTPEQRFDLTILDNMLLQDDAITRTEIWMALQLLLSGSVVCQGPKYPSKTLSMGRDPSLTVALTGALRWGQTGVDPLQNIRAWSTQVQRVSGFKPRTVLLDPLAGDMLINSATVTKVMNSYRQTAGNIDLAGKTTGGAVGQEVAFLGSLPEFDFWQYQELYEDDAGNIQQFMPNNTVILANIDALQGIKTYGAVRDRRAGFKAMPRFPKVWDVEEPAATLQNMASAPLPLFGWINASLAATVA